MVSVMLGIFATVTNEILPTGLLTSAVLSQRYKVPALSTLIVVDPAGKVTFKATDPGPDQIQTALEKPGAR